MLRPIQKFLRHNPVFTYRDFVQNLESQKPRSPYTYKVLLSRYLKQGHIVRIRRGLFASIPLGAEPATYPINPYLITSALAEESIIAYHTALAFYNINYTIPFRFLYLAPYFSAPVCFREETYQSVQFPKTLKLKNQEKRFVNREIIDGREILVTSLERTLVDCLDKPELGGGFEEIWRSFEMVAQLNIDHIIEYALLLNKVTTIAKVGFFLEQYQSLFHVTESQLKLLHTHQPRSPYYITKKSEKRAKLTSWNIIVPIALLHQNWEEVRLME